MVRRKVEVRREEILTATVAEVQRRGFARTRVSDVAGALDISPGLVFYHFASKESLLTAALEYAVEQDLARLDAAVAQATSAKDRLGDVLALYAPQGEARGWTVWIDAWASALRQPEMRQTICRLDRRWRDALQQVITDGVAAGEFDCPDPKASAQRLTALLDGLAVHVTVHRELSGAELRDWVSAAATAELGVQVG